MKIRSWLSIGGVVLCLLVGLLLPTSLVNAGALTVSVDAPVTVAPASDFVVKVNITEVTNLDTAQFNVVFNSDVLEISNPSPGADITNGLIASTPIPVVSAYAISPGKVRVVINLPGTGGVSGSGYLCELHFHVIGLDGTSSDINLEDGLLGDNEAHEIPATWLGATVNVGALTEPAIAFSPTSFSFSAIEGGANPADQTLGIWNSGTGTLDWSVSKDAAWLSLSPTTGSSTGVSDITNVTVSVDITDVSAGDHSAAITISALGATNTPQTVAVSLHISSAVVTYYTLTVNVSPSGSGTVSLNPTQPTGGYEAGITVTLTANKASGYKFALWSEDASGTSTTTEVVMTSHKSVTANFSKVVPAPKHSVGGTAYPPNKLAILAPWIALCVAIIAGATLFIRHRIARS